MTDKVVTEILVSLLCGWSILSGWMIWVQSSAIQQLQDFEMERQKKRQAALVKAMT